MKNTLKTTIAAFAMLAACSAHAFPVAVAHVSVPHVTVAPHVSVAPHVTPAAHVSPTPHVAPVAEAVHAAPSAVKAAAVAKPARVMPTPVVMNPAIGFGTHSKCADQNKAGCKQ